MDFFINIILSGGKTVHNRLKVPIHLNEDTLLSAAMNETTRCRIIYHNCTTVTMSFDHIVELIGILVAIVTLRWKEERKEDSGSRMCHYWSLVNKVVKEYHMSNIDSTMQRQSTLNG